MQVPKNLFTLLLLATIASCAVSPEEINYHEDECAFCKMKISDSRFGAELVTFKGKIYKYDSAECLFSILAESSPNEYGYIMVTDFTSPKTLVDATRAIYLISPKRPSPMGGNLSAYAYMSTAQSAHDGLGGSLLDFDEVLAKYKALR